MIPLGPAPYRKMLTVPKGGVRMLARRGEGGGVSWRCTIDEADDDADGC